MRIKSNRQAICNIHTCTIAVGPWQMSYNKQPKENAHFCSNNKINLFSENCKDKIYMLKDNCNDKICILIAIIKYTFL